VNEYNKTLIEITGHTDSTGSDAHNQQLSEQRANSVASYFRSRQVVPQRLVTEGFGERFPIATTTPRRPPAEPARRAAAGPAHGAG
jgi:outer membrane protein OmpA-like peptidoglycan-associated protein